MSKNSSVFELLYHPRALKFLKKIPKKDAVNILEKLEKLATNPNPSTVVTNLDIKRLATTQKSFRLRVGKIRVVYEIEEQSKIIYIQDIDFRGNIY